MTKVPPSKQVLLHIAYYMAPLAIFLGIWVPVIHHYYVPKIVITEEIIDTARRVPTVSVLDDIERFFKSREIKDSKELIACAQMVLQGTVAIPGAPSSAIGFPFDIDDLDKKLPGWQLFFARFSIPELLLRAYEVSGRDNFLLSAKDMILGFASYERNAWLPKGLLWNDHAIAARISVMVKFWKLYRNHPEYQSEVARDLFQLVARSGQMLAKPSHFTFSTNHGIMQNLALWQICIAFPTLPTAAQFRHLAFERMRDQMTFYINNEGVVLEHSAGYQRAGLEFISMAFRYLTLMNVPIPEKWRAKYTRAKTFYAQLRRPDGTLPMFGDTGIGRDNLGPLVTNVDATGQSSRLNYNKTWAPEESRSLCPIAGYSVWWDGLNTWPNDETLSQTVVAWSHFPGHGHKHADEMSVLLWAGGQKWWTNVGYWGYGTKGRSEAVSWAGSNAPHLLNEPTDSARTTTLKFHGWSEELALIDLERRGPGEYVARRQVVKLKPNVWLVIDHTSGNNNDRTITTWTTSPEISLSEGTIPGSYILRPEKNSAGLTKFILASAGTEIRQLRGSFTPFAGWVQNRPAPAIVIEQPADNSWAVAIWSMQNSTGPTLQFEGPPSMQYWQDPENWKIVLPVSSSVVNIWRKDNRVFVNKGIRGSGDPTELILSKVPQLTNELADIHNGRENAAKKYPPKRYSMGRHSKATSFLLLVFVLQEVFFIIYRRMTKKYYTELRVLNSTGWIAIGIWFFTVYL